MADAATLRARAEALRADATRGGGRAPSPGPDAATSGRMADACEAVVRLLRNLPATGDASDVDREAALEALAALVPVLEGEARASGGAPAVRSVYAGAATRVREVLAAAREG